MPQPSVGDQIWNQVTHGFADSSGVKIHYVTAGNGPLLVMIHGFPDFWYTWKEQIAALATFYQVVAIDQRGFNESDKPRGVENYALSRLSDDVEAVIRHFGEDQAIVVGHDWGGAVAWETAMHKPELVHRLVVLNLPHFTGLRRELARYDAQHAASEYAREFQQDGSHDRVVFDDQLWWLAPGVDRDRHAEALRRSDMESLMNIYKANYPREPYVDDRPLVKVQAPVLLIHGLNDTALLPGALNDTWQWVEKDLTLVTVPGAGHFVQHDAAPFVSRTIMRWLLDRE